MPSNPPELLVLDAMLAELQAITAGSEYFYTPKMVQKGYKIWEDCDAFPALFINVGAAQPAPSEVKSRRRLTKVAVDIYGHISDEIDPHTVTLKLLADVRKAVFVDVTHGGTAHLTTLTGYDTDQGALAPYGTFRLGLEVSVYHSY